MTKSYKKQFRNPKYTRVDSFKVGQIFDHILGTYELRTMLEVVTATAPSVKAFNDDEIQQKLTKIATAGINDYLKATSDDYNSTLYDKEFNVLVEQLTNNAKINFVLNGKAKVQKIVADDQEGVSQ